MSLPPQVPETRLSLLARLSSPEDRDAWVDFVELYSPVIFRTARYLGLQPSDADDVVQRVLVSVSRALQQRPHDPQQARFRTWLMRVTRNATLNALTRGKPDRGSGDSVQQQLLATLPEPQQAEVVLERETQRELFQQAAKQVQGEFAAETWQAFWRTTVEGEDIAAVARELGKQAGSIYAARSRVMRRLKEAVVELSGE